MEYLSDIREFKLLRNYIQESYIIYHKDFILIKNDIDNLNIN